MAVWSYTPQAIMEETLTTAPTIVAVSPQSEIVGWLVTTAIRAWRLQYTITDSATCNSMVAFWESVNGPWKAFQFWNPNAAALVTVRFDSGLTTEMFGPGHLRLNEIRLVAVHS